MRCHHEEFWYVPQTYHRTRRHPIWNNMGGQANIATELPLAQLCNGKGPRRATQPANPPCGVSKRILKLRIVSSCIPHYNLSNDLEVTTESEKISPLYASNDLDGITKKFKSELTLACVWKASDATPPRTPFTSWHNKIRCCPWTLGMLPQTIVNFQPPHSYYSEDSDTKLIEGGLTFQTNAFPHMDTEWKRSRTTP